LAVLYSEWFSSGANRYLTESISNIFRMFEWILNHRYA
jgi:hypothetical protein